MPLLVVLLFCEPVQAIQYAYQVNFTNKNGTLALSDSLSFLSSRSLARRDRQGIPLDSTDLPVTRAYVDSVLTLTGGKFHEASKWFNFCVVLLSDSTTIHALDGKSFISSYKLVAYYTGSLHRDQPNAVTGKPQAGRTTSGDAAYYDATWTQTLMVNGNYVHDLGYKGAGKIIAVLDAGFIGVDTHRGFDSLRASGRLVDEHNFTYDTSYVYGYDIHGMQVLSTMAGYVPDTFVGTAPLASYALYITEDDPTEQPIELLNMVCGSERADSIGADIITTSLGYNTFDNSSYDFNYSADFDGKTTIAAKGANMATKKGMLFVATAGNEGGSGWNHILTPGDADSALTIGSVDNAGNNAVTSGYGPNAAGQIKPDVCDMGHYASVFSTTDYEAQDGTSFSTPQIAGWAACLWESKPDITPAQLRLAIIICANHYTTPGTQIGYGVPDFECTANALNVIDTPTPASYDNWITVAPNPIVNILYLTLFMPSQQVVNCRLFDVTGREVLSYSAQFKKGWNQPVAIDLYALPPGMYFLKAVTPFGQKVIKIDKL